MIYPVLSIDRAVPHLLYRVPCTVKHLRTALPAPSAIDYNAAMTVILAEVLGYCMGVRRAVDSAHAALSGNRKAGVFSLGPLIHNRAALNALESQGLCVLDENGALSAPAASTVIIRAHGVPPAVHEALLDRQCTVINATCPRVTSSQRLAAYYAARGALVILAGDRNHGEVTGIAGYAGSQFRLVQNRQEALSFFPQSDEESAILLSQTTFNPAEFEAIARILREKYTHLKVVNTICSATLERQEALLRLCPLVDGVLVVGGKNSANTARLFQTAQTHCAHAALIEDSSEIPNFFFALETVGITAGASTPDSVIEEARRALLAGRS